MKIVAKTIKGQEYIYSRNSAHKVSERGAVAICEALNENRWKLKDGEIWHVYEIGDWEADYCGAAYQSFERRRGCLYERGA